MRNVSLKVRVNGIPVDRINIRRQIRGGYPDGPKEIVITDPTLGKFAIDDSFNIEFKEGKRWRKTFVSELLTMLESLEATTS
jgi:hypothetical protein